MIDRSSLLASDLERIPKVLLGHAKAARRAMPVRAPGVPLSRRIVLTGLGSSRFAALVVAPYLRAVGLDVVVEHASTRWTVPLAPGTLLVAISNSGRTPEVVAAAHRGRGAGAAVLAITNDPESALAAAADMVQLLTAGDEASGVASVTYAATVATLYRLAEALGAEIDAERTLVEAARIATEILSRRDGWLPEAADLLHAGAAIHLLADASALGTAEQAALLFREGPRLLAGVTDAGDWLHVGVYTALPGYRAILLSGTPYDDDVVSVIHGRGGRIIAIGPADTEHADINIPVTGSALGVPGIRALVESVVLGLIAAELWRRARANDA